MYTLNGTHPDLGVAQQFLNNGDEIIFHYTDDYTKEEGSEKWNKPTDKEMCIRDKTYIDPTLKNAFITLPDTSTRGYYYVSGWVYGITPSNSTEFFPYNYMSCLLYTS